MTRRAKALLAVLVVGVIVGIGAYGLHSLWSSVKSRFTADSCTVGSYDLDPSQASVASTVVAAVTTYRVHLPDRAAVLVLAAALQESKLTNIPPGQGDRDSVGVLQQRPSQGWGGGDANKLTDVTEATKEFLDHLVKVPHWQRRPLAEVVQDVQISADGSLYAQHEPEAAALANALLGRTPAGISCDFAAPTQVASATRVATLAGKQLGLETPTAVDRHVVRVPGAHWQTAAWFVANADRLGIEKVAYAGREWSRGHGWQKSATATKAAVTATMHQLKSG
jgi:hypothetical protein